MLLWLFLVFGRQIYASIDVGSEYLKIGVLNSENISEIRNLRSYPRLIPSSAAFKLQNPRDSPLSDNEVSKIPYLLGGSATKFLKRHQYAGSAFLPRIIGRNFSNDFNIPSFVAPTELFSLLLRDILSDIELSGLEGLDIVIPSYFTLRQRDALMESVWATKIPFFGLIDDVYATSYQYFSQFSSRFRSENHSVLFVDVGATKVEAYRVDFYFNQSFIGNQTFFDFSEKSGTFFFAKRLSIEKGISISKAGKTISSQNESLFEEELQIIEGLVRSAASNPVDEVQVIGGGSKLAFVRRRIQSAVGKTPVLAELSPFFTIALGGASISPSISSERSQTNFSFYRTSVYTTRVQCGNVSTEYCMKNANCSEIAILDNTICKDLTISAQTEEVPEGAGNELSVFTMTNISSFKHEEDEVVSGVVECVVPLPVVSNVMWCITAILDCTPISVVQKDIEEEKFRLSAKAVDAMIAARVKRNAISSLRSAIADDFERMTIFLAENKGVGIEGGLEELQNEANELKVEDDLGALKRGLESIKEKMRKIGVPCD